MDGNLPFLSAEDLDTVAHDERQICIVMCSYGRYSADMDSDGRETRMLVEERRRRLLELIGSEGRVVAEDVSERFGVSADAIRRDLRELAAEGLVKRVRGGALAPVQARHAAPFASRARSANPSLDALSLVAAQRLANLGGVVVFDAGATSVRIATHLRTTEPTTLVTSSPAVAVAAIDSGSQVLLLGGIVDIDIGAAVDSTAVDALRRVHADVAVLGTCAVDSQRGVSTARFREVAFKKALVVSAAEVWIVAPSEKLATVAGFAVADIAEISCLVTDASADHPAIAGFVSAGIEVVHVRA